MAKKKIDLKKWHKAVCEKYNYICQGCKKDYSHECYFLEDGRNAYVCGHHLKSQKAFPELRLEVSNGICVDAACHELIHRGLLKVNNENVINYT